LFRNYGRALRRIVKLFSNLCRASLPVKSSLASFVRVERTALELSYWMTVPIKPPERASSDTVYRAELASRERWR
jgi:hypothetical protein